MSRFAGLKQQATAAAPAAAETPSTGAPSSKAKAREGKVLVGGYFGPEVRRGLHQLALDEGATIQGLVGEALDLLMRSRGRHPFGER